jgi:hypothetical protein
VESGKCEGPGGGIDGVHYAPGFTLVCIETRYEVQVFNHPSISFGYTFQNQIINK